MKNLHIHEDALKMQESKETYREVLYTLMVQREAMKSSHVRMIRKLRSLHVH